MSLTQRSAGGEPLPVFARGQLIYRPDAGALTLKDTRVETELAAGLCLGFAVTIRPLTGLALGAGLARHRQAQGRRRCGPLGVEQLLAGPGGAAVGEPLALALGRAAAGEQRQGEDPGASEFHWLFPGG